MGVYIKGMEIPASCGQCQFFAWSRGVGQHCAVASEITFHATIDGMDVAYERNGSCPLVPVPTHGDLIEESKVLDIVSEWCPDDDGSVGKVGDLREMLDEIESLPTILEAEEGEA